MEKYSFYLVASLFGLTVFFMMRAGYLNSRLFLYLMNNRYEKYCELTTFNQEIGPGFFIFGKAKNYIFSGEEDDGNIETKYKLKIKRSLVNAAGSFALLIAFVLFFSSVAINR